MQGSIHACSSNRSKVTGCILQYGSALDLTAKNFAMDVHGAPAELGAALEDKSLTDAQHRTEICRAEQEVRIAGEIVLQARVIRWLKDFHDWISCIAQLCFRSMDLIIERGS